MAPAIFRSPFALFGDSTDANASLASKVLSYMCWGQ